MKITCYNKFIIFLLFLLPLQVFAAFDANGCSASPCNGWNLNVSSVTFPHTITGTNPVLSVGVYTYNVPPVVRVSSMTYDGVSMSLATSTLSSLESNQQSVEMWTQAAPNTGTHNIVITYASLVQYSVAISSSYTDVDQMSPVDSYGTAQSLTSASSLTVTSNVSSSNCWLTGFAGSRGGVITAGTGTTLRQANNGTYSAAGDSNGEVGTGSQSLQFSAPSGTWPGGIVIALKKYVSPVVNTQNNGCHGELYGTVYCQM